MAALASTTIGRAMGIHRLVAWPRAPEAPSKSPGDRVGSCFSGGLAGSRLTTAEGVARVAVVVEAEGCRRPKPGSSSRVGGGCGNSAPARQLGDGPNRQRCRAGCSTTTCRSWDGCSLTVKRLTDWRRRVAFDPSPIALHQDDRSTPLRRACTTRTSAASARDGRPCPVRWAATPRLAYSSIRLFLLNRGDEPAILLPPLAISIIS